MIRLTSGRNPVIKEISSLKRKSAREEKELFFIEGSRFVAEALKEGADMVYAVASDSFLAGNGSEGLRDIIEKDGIKFYAVPDSIFNSISDTQSPQGILAVMRLRKKRLEDAVPNGGLVVVLDSITDPGNMGAIIRTADAAGCAGVVVSSGCVDIYNPKVLRSTMGSVFHVPILYCGSMEEAAKKVKEAGFKLFVSHLEGRVEIYDADLSGNAALVFGNEAGGVSEAAVREADLLVKIPMAGRAESLNVSVAAGIMLFEALRQRNRGGEASVKNLRKYS